MKKKAVILTMALALLVVSLTGCGETKKCINTLKEFQYACNNLDLNAMLDCINPEIADPIRVIIATWSKLTEQDKDELIDGLVSEVIEGLDEQDIDVKEFLPLMEIEPKDFQIKKNNAYVRCKVTAVISGVQVKRYLDIYMRKFDGDWYIQYLEFSTQEYE